MSRQPPRRRPPAKRNAPKSKAKAKPKAKAASARKKTTTPRKTTARSQPRKRTPAPLETAPLAGLPEASTQPEPLTADTQWTFRSQLKRISLKDRPTQLALGSIAVIIVLIAVIAVWPKSSTKTSSLTDAAAGGPETSAEQVTDVEGNVVENAQRTGSGAAQQAAGPAEEFQDNPFANTEYAKYVASLIKPQSTDYPNGNPNTWAGVSKTEIKAVFSYDQANCGVNLISAISAAGAQFGTSTRYYQAAPRNQTEANEDTVKSIDTLVQVFNDVGWEATVDFPQLRPLLEKFGSPERPFYGRRLVHQKIDGGSFQCKPTTDAAASEIAEEIKPFVVFNNFDGAQYNMAEALNAKAKDCYNQPCAQGEGRPMHFGTLWLSDQDYTRWAPYVWTQFNSGTRGAELYMSWACSRLVGQKATNAPDYKNTERKFALLYPKLPQATKLAAEYVALSQQYCGKDIFAHKIAYEPDPSRAADEGTSIGIRLKLDNVTTLTYVTDPVFPIFQLVQFQGQDYQPEFAWTPSGYYDSSTVQRIYQSLAVDYYVTSFGVTQFGVPGGFGFTAGDPFWVWHDNHKVAPSGKPCDPSSDAGMNHDEEYCKAPGSIVTWYYTTLPLLAGVIFSGPDLNPKFVSQGLQSYPKIRYGIAGPTDSPHPAQLGSGPGKFYFIVDGLEYRWRGDYISPPPEQKVGWVNYADCERHYTLWPNDYSTGWEPGGPNHGAFCGDAKYADFKYEPGPGVDGDPNSSCADDAPGGQCKKDGYPRWRDWEQG